MATITFILTENQLTFVVDGKSITVNTSHPNFEAIKKALKDGDAPRLVQLTDIPKAVKEYSGNTVEIRDDKVFYKGEEQHSYITDRILAVMRAGLPFEPLLKFLENLMKNPSNRAVQELYAFLEHKGLPITEDGHFLAYKRLRPDWTDINSGKFDNSIGKVVKMRRNLVDENWRQACSSGFHVGSMEYVRNFHSEGGNPIAIVKVNPKDVVAVPERECTKMRVCRYEVIEEYQGLLDQSPVYTSQAPVAPVVNTITDDDDEDDEICDICGCDMWSCDCDPNDYENDDEDYDDEEE